MVNSVVEQCWEIREKLIKQFGGLDGWFDELQRLDRKRSAALELRDRIGESFGAVVTGTSKKATWIRLTESGIEGRLVRGRRGLSPNDAINVVLLAADPVRGFIDFALSP